MKRLLFLLIVALLALPLVAQDDELPDEIIVEVPGIQAEGIAWDAEGERFLLGSLTQGTIFQVIDDDGTTEPFIEDEDFMATVGIHIDEANNRLLVPSSDSTVFFSDAPGAATLFAFDLETGERLFAADLTAIDAAEGTRYFANDVTVDDEGTTYVTNSFAPVIYAVDMDGEASIFIEDERLSAPFFGLNGIDYHPDGYLLAAVASGVIYKIPLDDPSALVEQVELTPGVAIDGMVLAENNTTLVAIGYIAGGDTQGDTQYAFAITSDDDWASAQIAAQVDTGGAATTIAIRDDAAFFINAYLNNPQAEQYEIVNAGFDADLLAAEPDDMMEDD